MICHRDLKPNNIMCDWNGDKVKITDFNVSKFSNEYKEFTTLDKKEHVEMWTYTGTVAYSAPEILMGHAYK